MKPLSVSLINFGSYKKLDFNFENQGLILLYGNTGSGKSTLLDAVTWCLYGQTAKGGKSDDIRSWTSKESTIGYLTVETKTGIIGITRVRGKDNDLYFSEAENQYVKIRGKDLFDTQSLIEERLCINFSQYVTASYSCDQSPSQVFFVGSAKLRRELFEKITDLSLPARLLEKTQNVKKIEKNTIHDLQTTYDRGAAKVDSLRSFLEQVASSSDSWDKSHSEKIKKLQYLRDNFEIEKSSKIEALKTKIEAWNNTNKGKINKLKSRIGSIVENMRPWEELNSKFEALVAASRCPQCNGVIGEKEKEVQKAQRDIHKNMTLEQDKNRLKEEHDRIDKEINPHIEVLNNFLTLENHYQEQLIEEIHKENPYESQWKKLSNDYADSKKSLLYTEKALDTAQQTYKALNHLQDLASDLRAELLVSTVLQIQDKTNELLQTYFEGAFRVQFTASSDNLDVSIQKSGYECSYLQLSKGQRRLLTLCFGISVMEATDNNLGIHSDCLMFDEPTDGCDSELKLSAYSLFEELASRHSTVLIIDHDKGLQNQFHKKFKVELVGDHSELEEE